MRFFISSSRAEIPPQFCARIGAAPCAAVPQIPQIAQRVVISSTACIGTRSQGRAFALLPTGTQPYFVMTHRFVEYIATFYQFVQWTPDKLPVRRPP